MQILLASDLHYRLPQYDWLVEVAAEFDVVALPGDHLSIAGYVPPPAQIVVVARYLGMLGERTSVVTSSGNHDLDGPGSHGEQVARWMLRSPHPAVHVDNSGVDVEGTRFTMCPWWDGPITRAELDDLLEREAALRSPTGGSWVWLYHSPPADTGPCTNGRRSFPDPDLVALIERWDPDMVLTGHIHEAPWAPDGAWAAQVGSTWVFNAGSRPGPIPPHVIIDTDARRAEWWAPPDHDELELS